MKAQPWDSTKHRDPFKVFILRRGISPIEETKESVGIYSKSSREWNNHLLHLEP